ncbi:MAG: transporter substrate-binding domain-containing protein [bacterium]|nr:transporter substrate-binding domain-containing protein [bacterium]
MRHKKLILFYSVLLILVLCVMRTLYQNRQTALSTRDYPEIQAEGVLHVVTEYNQSGYYVKGDTIEGFQYELCQAIARESGLEVQIHLEMNLSESYRMLNEQTCDLIAQNIPITNEIKDSFLFTDPLVLNKQVLVQRTAAANHGIEPIRNQLDLAKKTLYIPQHSPARLRLINLEHEIGDTLYWVEEERYSSEQLAIMVAKGDIDFAVCDQQIAQLAQQRMNELDIQTDISFTQLQAWAVRKSSPILRDSLNVWLKRVHDNGLYDKLYKQYYNKAAR